MKNVHLGFEIGTGQPVSIPLHHVVVTGVTQLSGKTTTLESLIRRSGMKAIAFRTKRGESGFEDASRHAPYFHERADWQYVQSLLEATMREKMKFERSWIIKVCKGARSLRDVLHNVERELQTAKGINEGVYTNLKAYLDLVLPEIERTPMTKALDLKTGINVMDLIGLRDEVQSLVIASTLEAVYRTQRDCVVVIPEAWKYCPEGRGSPVKQAAESLIRQGASIGVYLWFDSQDIAGVDKALLKQVDNWILGRQRESNEVEHTLAQVPLPAKLKPRPEEIMSLGIGQFVACFDDKVKKVYVQPWWLSDEEAQLVALGTKGVASVMDSRPKASQEFDMSRESELVQALKAAEDRSKRLENDLNEALEAAREAANALKETEALRQAERARNATAKSERTKNEPSVASMDQDSIVQMVIERLKVEPGVILNISKASPEIRLTLNKPIVEADDSTIRGKLAVLLSEGFFDQPRPRKDILAEVEARGWGDWAGGNNSVRMYNELQWFQSNYFMRKEGQTWFALIGSKGRVASSRQNGEP